MRSRAIIINSAGRLLLGLNEYDQYMLPGGKIKEKEHPVDALFREVYEETGIKEFDSIEYLWPYLGNHVFVYVPKNMPQTTCAYDPSNEFKSLEWFNLEKLPLNLNDYSEDIIYRFLRIEIFQQGKENTMKVMNASYIDVYVDGKKAFQLDDDTIWLTLPRLVQERSKGRKIQFKQISNEGKITDQTCQDHKAGLHDKTVKSCLNDKDVSHYNKCILLDVSSELLNPGVQILKVADTFSNTLLFDGKDEFWITHCNKPVWRSNYLHRYASYEEVVQCWNERYPKSIVDLDWFKDLLKKVMEEKNKSNEKKKLPKK